MEQFHVAHTSTGDMFRAAMANQTMQSQHIIKVSWFQMKLQMELLNAYRTTSKKQVSCWMVTHVRLNRSHALDKTLAELGIELEGVINIEVNLDCLLERLSGRIIHRGNRWNLPQRFQPTVDYKEIITNVRMTNLRQWSVVWMWIISPKVEPIINSLPCQGLVEGNQDINDVFKDIEKVLTNLK